MLRRFQDAPTRETRALQIWQILIAKAHNRQTMTYGELAEIMGFRAAGTLGSFLAPILHYCAQNDLPPLTCLVVNQDSGLPGEGFVAAANLHVQREAMYRYPWYQLYPPSPDDFKDAQSKA